MCLGHVIQLVGKQPHVLCVCLVDQLGCDSLVLVVVPGQLVLLDALLWPGSNVGSLGGSAACISKDCQCYPLALVVCPNQGLTEAVPLQLV